MPNLLAALRSTLAGRYAVERDIGRGSMATVFLAEDLLAHRQVAIKVLHPEFAISVGSGRFCREIRLLAPLDHPNILPILDFATSGSLLYYVMRFADGASLVERMLRTGPMPLGEAIAILRDVATAIDYAHGKNIIHRDIKPANVLFDRGRPMVCDFGVSRALTGAGDDRISSSGIVVGTPAYMSPEQATGSQLIDTRCDVYSLGCVAYEMLAGGPVFSGATAQAILARQLAERPRSLRVTRPELSPAVEAAVFAALAKEPHRRPATAGALVRLLEDASVV